MPCLHSTSRLLCRSLYIVYSCTIFFRPHIAIRVSTCYIFTKNFLQLQLRSNLTLEFTDRKSTRKCCNNINMSICNDDPRQVLALLNSLGFVGITGAQLKAFLKDLKVYRKMKERKRQWQKENIREKVLLENRQMIEELLHYRMKEACESVTDFEPSPNANTCANNSPLNVRIKYTAKSIDDQCQDCIQSTQAPFECTGRSTVPKYDGSNCNQQVHSLYDVGCIERQSATVDNTGISYHPSSAAHLSSNENIYNNAASERTGNEASKHYVTTAHLRPAGATSPFVQRREVQHKAAPLRQTTSARTCNVALPLDLNTWSQKSFIRPWHLHREACKLNSSKKSDPVTLYQRYQKEWKKMDVPGEAAHSTIRWAIRQKMLGMNPNPTPQLRRADPAPSGRKPFQ